MSKETVHFEQCVKDLADVEVNLNFRHVFVLVFELRIQVAVHQLENEDDRIEFLVDFEEANDVLVAPQQPKHVNFVVQIILGLIQTKCFSLMFSLKMIFAAYFDLLK